MCFLINVGGGLPGKYTRALLRTVSEQLAESHWPACPLQIPNIVASLFSVCWHVCNILPVTIDAPWNVISRTVKGKIPRGIKWTHPSGRDDIHPVGFLQSPFEGQAHMQLIKYLRSFKSWSITIWNPCGHQKRHFNFKNSLILTHFHFVLFQTTKTKTWTTPDGLISYMVLVCPHRINS